MDDYERKFQAALAELKNAGVWDSNASPPFLLIARNLGFKPRPPHYRNAFRTGIAHAVWFCGIWGFGMWAASWQQADLPAIEAVFHSAKAGTVFGVLMGGYYYLSQKRYKLRNWNAL